MTTADAPAEDLPTNWGRWGLEDDLGALNYVTDAARARGAAAATEGRVVSMALPLTPVPLAGGPMPTTTSALPAAVMQLMNYNGSPPPAFTDTLVINTHHVAMTHIDALVHHPVADHVYPGIPISEAIAGGTVRRSSTAAFASGVITRGVLLDLAPGARLDPGHEVTGSDLEAAERRANTRVESGDALVVRGGWTVFRDYKDGLPCMSLDAVRWMDARQVGLFAGDIGDRPPVKRGQPMPLHHVALARLGIPLIDGTEVESLASTCDELRRWTFLFALGPIPVHGATGIPVNPLAIF